MAGIRVLISLYRYRKWLVLLFALPHRNRGAGTSDFLNPSTYILIGLAFAAAVGITLLVLGCALNQFNNWWPMFLLTFYILVPIPTLMSRRMSGSFDSASSACVELCIFLTTGIVVSCMGLPIILARAAVIQWGACALVLSGSIVVFLTILGYFYVFANEDMDYSMW